MWTGGGTHDDIRVRGHWVSIGLLLLKHYKGNIQQLVALVHYPFTELAITIKIDKPSVHILNSKRQPSVFLLTGQFEPEGFISWLAMEDI
jgi:hypothetical protein